MERELLRLIAPDRAAEKQRARDLDAQRLEAGEVSPAQLQAENNFFAGLDLSSFRIAAIGDLEIDTQY